MWALGVVLDQMLTGQLPFGREHELTSRVVRILHEEPVPPSRLSPELPRCGRENRHQTLLEKEPAKRYASAP